MRRFDLTGGALLIGVAAVVIGGGAALVSLSVANLWELFGVAGVGVILIAAAHPHHGPTGPRNSFVHGAARPAAPDETHKAARGDSATPGLHDQHFSD